MSRKNGQKYRNFMAFRQKNLERQKGNLETGSAHNQYSRRANESGENHGSNVEEKIKRHKIFAMSYGDMLLKYARECYATSGRGAVTMKDEDIVNINPYKSTQYGVKLYYVNPGFLETLPATIALKAVGMANAYNPEDSFVFLVFSNNGMSVYTCGIPYRAADDSVIDADGGQP